MFLPILFFIEPENLIPIIASTITQMLIKVEATVKNIAGKLANDVIKGVKHKNPIKNKTQKPTRSSFLVVLFLIKIATEVPPIQAATIATMLNKKTITIITNTIRTGRTNNK